jgi:hypothetical protein
MSCCPFCLLSLYHHLVPVPPRPQPNHTLAPNPLNERHHSQSLNCLVPSSHPRGQPPHGHSQGQAWHPHQELRSLECRDANRRQEAPRRPLVRYPQGNASRVHPALVTMRSNKLKFAQLFCLVASRHRQDCCYSRQEPHQGCHLCECLCVCVWFSSADLRSSFIIFA